MNNAYVTPLAEVGLLTDLDRGVMWTPIDMLTADDYDLQFGTNVLGAFPVVCAVRYLKPDLPSTGPFYFTKLLLPALTETAKNTPERQVRIVSEASIMRHYVHTIRFDTLRPGKPRNRAGSNELYCQSKFVSITCCTPSPVVYGLRCCDGTM